MQVSIMITCIADMMYPQAGKDTVELLERFGCVIDFPTDQTCCGQPAFNSGYLKRAKEAIKQTIQVFETSPYVVSPSGSCVAMVKQYPDIFRHDQVWYERAKQMADKTYELTQFLVYVLNVTDVQSTFSGTITYHPSCHMTRILGEKEAPLQLLHNIKGATLIETERQEDCCGFGGTFAIKNSALSTEMVTEKTTHIEEAGVHYVVGCDVACLMNIEGKLTRDGKRIEVRHIAELLNTVGA